MRGLRCNRWFGALRCQRNDGGRHPPTADLNASNRDRELEAARPCTSRIQIQDSLALLDLRPMRVAADDHSEPGGTRVQIELCRVVQHIEEYSAGLHDLGICKFWSPRAFVVIAAHRNDRADLPQRLEDFRRADVASMQDQLTTGERIKCLRRMSPCVSEMTPTIIVVFASDPAALSRPGRRTKQDRPRRPRGL